MSWHEDHINAVADRWRIMRLESTLSADEFEAYARKTLSGYGWSGKDLETLVRKIMKNKRMDEE
jgi:hypothetical protein